MFELNKWRWRSVIGMPVRPSVCRTRESSPNGSKYRNIFHLIRYSDVSGLWCQISQAWISGFTANRCVK